MQPSLLFMELEMADTRDGVAQSADPSMTAPSILTEEANAIKGHNAIREGLTGKQLYQALNAQGLTGLALSGGGIRSATFSLGVVQALAAHMVSRPDDPSAKDSLL
jgi:predicted acylesterase/phospholipase RssA